MSPFHISYLTSTSHTLNNLLEISRPSLLFRIFLSPPSLPRKRKPSKRIFGVDLNEGAYFPGNVIDRPLRDRLIDQSCVEPESDSETDSLHDCAIPARRPPLNSPPRQPPPNRHRVTIMSRRGRSENGSVNSWGDAHNASPNRSQRSPRETYTDRVTYFSIRQFTFLILEENGHRNRRRNNDRNYDDGDVTYYI